MGNARRPTVSHNQQTLIMVSGTIGVVYAAYAERMRLEKWSQNIVRSANTFRADPESTRYCGGARTAHSSSTHASFAFYTRHCNTPISSMSIWNRLRRLAAIRLRPRYESYEASIVAHVPDTHQSMRRTPAAHTGPLRLQDKKSHTQTLSAAYKAKKTPAGI